MGGWMGGWMDGRESRVKDCLQQSTKIAASTTGEAKQLNQEE
jgi:hypothetical protein